MSEGIFVLNEGIFVLSGLLSAGIFVLSGLLSAGILLVSGTFSRCRCSFFVGTVKSFKLLFSIFSIIRVNTSTS